MDWRALVASGVPGPDEVRVVRIPLDGPSADLAETLSADERERAARFVFDVHRRRFVAARASLRRVLALCLDRDPAGLSFEYTDRGRPSLRLASHPDFDFNLAHSGDLALLALSSRTVGVDVEQRREMPNALAIARRFFSPRELAAESEPSARTRACRRPLRSLSTVPGRRSPASISTPNGMRGSERLPGVGVTSSAASGVTSAMRLRASVAYVRSRSSPTKCRPRRLATAPVVPVPKNGSRTVSPGLVAAIRQRNSNASGFWVGCAFLPSSPFSRSPPVQSGNSQSERICRSSLSAFIAR